MTTKAVASYLRENKEKSGVKNYAIADNVEILMRQVSLGVATTN